MSEHLKKGDKVLAKYPPYRGRKGNPWFTGTVLNLEHGGTCQVKWDSDGSLSIGVRASEVVYCANAPRDVGKGRHRYNDLNDAIASYPSLNLRVEMIRLDGYGKLVRVTEGSTQPNVPNTTRTFKVTKPSTQPNVLNTTRTFKVNTTYDASLDKTETMGREVPYERERRRLELAAASVNVKDDPIWMNKAFVGEFGDAFVADTSLEGGHIGPSIVTMVDVAKLSVKEYRRSNALSCFRKSSDFNVVNTVLEKLSQAARVEFELNRVSYPDNFEKFVSERAKEVQDLSVSDFVIWPGGWLEQGGGHAIMYTIERTSRSKVSMIVHNTGQGVGYHPSPNTPENFPKLQRYTSMRLDDIPIERLVDPSWLYVLFRLKKFSADDHKPVMVYEVLIPHLLQSPIEPRARASLKGPYAKYAVPETLQRAGVCYYRCILCAMRYALRRLGLSQNHVKQLRVTMRRGYLLCVKRGLNRILQVVSSSKTTPDLPGLYPSQRRLVRLASKQVAYASEKESRKGRMSQDVLQTVANETKEIETLLKRIPTVGGESKHPVVPSEIKPVDIEGCAEDAHFDGLNVSSIASDLEIWGPRLDELAGSEVVLAKVRPINFSVIPRHVTKRCTNSEIVNLLMASRRVCLEIRDVGALKERRGAASLQVDALLQNLFLEVLPIPKHDDTSCPWIPTSFSHRKNTLKLLDWFSREFTAASLSCPASGVRDKNSKGVACPPDSMQSARVLTHTTIMCAYFHVLRHDAKSDKDKLASVLPKLLESKRIGFRTLLATSESLAVLTASLRHDRVELLLARFQILLFIQHHERWRRTIGFDFTFKDGKIAAFGTSDKALTFVQTFNAAYRAAGGGQHFRSGAMPPNMSQFLAWRQTMAQVSELERRSAWLVLSASQLGSKAPQHLYQFRDMIFRFQYGVQAPPQPASMGQFQVPPLATWKNANIQWKYECNKKKTRAKFEISFSGLKCDTSVGCRKYPASLADLRRYNFTDKRGSMITNDDITEDDILHSPWLEDFEGSLSQEDAEQMFTILTAPYVRIPLILEFFAQERAGSLFNERLRALLMQALFEPREWSDMDTTPPEVQTIPVERKLLATSRGILMAELERGAGAAMSPLLRLLHNGARLCLPGSNTYTSSAAGLLRFLVRLACYVQEFAQVARVSSNASDLNKWQCKLQEWFDDIAVPALETWSDSAGKDENTRQVAVFRAHLAMVSSISMRNSTLTRDEKDKHASRFLCSSSFVVTWHGSPHETGSHVDEGKPDDDKKKKEEGKSDDKKEEDVPQNASSIFGGMSHSDIYNTIQRTRHDLMDWIQSSSSKVGADTMTECVSLVMRRGNPDGSAPTDLNFRSAKLDAQYKAVTKDESESYRVDVQQCDVALEKSGLKPVPEKIARMLDFQSYFGAGNVPHCAEVSRHKNRHVLRIVGEAAIPFDVSEKDKKKTNSSNNIRISSWTPVAEGEAADILGAPKETQIGKALVFESRHNYSQRDNKAEVVRVSGAKKYRIVFDPRCNTEKKYDKLAFFWHGKKKQEKKEFHGILGHSEGWQQSSLLIESESFQFKFQCDTGNFFWGYKFRVIAMGEGVTYVSLRSIPTIHPHPSTNTHTHRYCDVEYGRTHMYGMKSPNDIPWLGRILDPVLWNEFTKDGSGSGRGKRKWIELTKDRDASTLEYLLPSKPLARSAASVTLLLAPLPKSGNGLWREVRVSRTLQCVDVFLIDAFGRRAFPCQIYSSDARFALHNMVPDKSSLVAPLPNSIKHHSGQILSVGFNFGSLCVLDEADPDNTRLLVPARFLAGQLPAALLENFRWWQIGYTGNLEGERLVRFRPSEKGESVPYVDPFFEYSIETRVGRQFGLKSSIDMTLVLRVEDPIVKTKRILNRMSMGSKMARALVNLRQLRPDSPLLPVLSQLVRMERLSHILVWTTAVPAKYFSGVWPPADVNAITPEIVELPRLRVSFKLKRNRKTGAFELHSIDRHGLFVTGISEPPQDHNDVKPHLLHGLSHGLVLKSFSGTRFVMLPNFPLRRSQVKFCPFSVTTFPRPENRVWQAACGSARTCVYEIHSSGEFVLYPSVLSALYWAYSKLAARRYISAFRALESAGTDMPLSWAERTVIEMFKDISDDNHPDAHACRIKLRLAMIYAPLSNWPVRGEDFVIQDYTNYLSKISHVSFACRLSFEDELHLMSHIRKVVRKKNKGMKIKDPILQQPITANREVFLKACVQKKTSAKRGSGGSDILRQALESTKLALKAPSRMKNGGYSWYCNVQKLRGTQTRTSIFSSQKALGFVKVGKASHAGKEIPNLWFANVTYGGTQASALVGGACINKCDSMWLDNIVGGKNNLGYAFLSEVLCSNLQVKLLGASGRRVECSRLMGEILTRIFVLKRNSASLTYPIELLIGSCEARSLRFSPPLLPSLNGARTYPNTSYSSSRSRDGSESFLKYMEQHSRALYNAQDSIVACALAMPKGQCQTVKVNLHSRSNLYPKIINYACDRRNMTSVSFGDASVDSKDSRAFATRPLSASLDIDRFVKTHDLNSDDMVPPKPPLDVDRMLKIKSGSLARETLSRITTDWKKFAEGQNNRKIVALSGISPKSLRDAKRGRGVEFADSGIRTLNELKPLLEQAQRKDADILAVATHYIVKTANHVPIPRGGDDEDISAALRFHLRRYSGQESSLWLEHLVASLLSTDSVGDVRRLNPYLETRNTKRLLDAVVGIVLRANRIAQWQRCRGAEYDVRKAIGKARESESPGHVGKLQKEIGGLVGNLAGKRYFVEEKSADFDPRLLVFEYMFGWLLRKSQVYLVETFVRRATKGAPCQHDNGKTRTHSMVHQMIMGAGKTTCIGPLLALILGNGKALVTQVVPDALLTMSRNVMWSRFTQIMSKRVFTLRFTRSDPSDAEAFDEMREKLERARKTAAVVVTTPATIKSLVNKFIESLTTLSCAPRRLFRNARNLSQKDKQRVQEVKTIGLGADSLARVLSIWSDRERGILLMDEVDMLLHPLRSELNFPIGQKFPLEPKPRRWNIPMFLIDTVLRAVSSQDDSDDNEDETEVQRKLRKIVSSGYRNMQLQRSPHLVLLDRDWYTREIAPILAQSALSWLKSHHVLAASRDSEAILGDKDTLEYLIGGPSRTSSSVLRNVRKMKGEIIATLTLTHSWITLYMPHVLAKVNRVSFGLLQSHDLETLGRQQPMTRLKLAVPFVGKDCPSRAAEFAQPDVLIGMTILGFRYEGMRISDLKEQIRSLKTSFQLEAGPKHSRPSSVLFQRWQRSARRLGLDRRKKRERLPPLELFQPSEPRQINALFAMLRLEPNCVSHYLTHHVFPSTMHHQRVKICSSGQELGSRILFGRRIGFSGTPSSLLPSHLLPCHFEHGSEAKILYTLTNPDITTESPLSKELEDSGKMWSAKGILDEICDSNLYHALIDTGALITGYSNEEVARYLIDHGLKHLQGCVFLDATDHKMIYIRGAEKSIPLAESGLSRDKRFTFYDQVHTTGMDIKQSLNAIALQTVGSKMSMRDLSQGAFRMRKIGVGQKIHLYVIPEVKKLIREGYSRTGTLAVRACGWLQLNGLRLDQLQFLQLASQNIQNVWRRVAFDNLLASSGVPNIKGVKTKVALTAEKRLSRFTRDKFLMLCLKAMQDTVEFDIPQVVPKMEPYGVTLKRMADQNSALITTAAQQHTIDSVLRMVSSGDDGKSDDAAASNSLGSEMTREREREQEQEQQKEQEKEQDNAFARDEREQIKWNAAVLNRSRVGDAISRSASDDKPFLMLNKFSPRPTDFKWRGADGRQRRIEKVQALAFPNSVLLSCNFAPPYAMEQSSSTKPMKLRNSIMVLEFKPQRDTTHTIALTLSEAEAIRLYLQSNRANRRSNSNHLRLVALRANGRILADSNDSSSSSSSEEKVMSSDCLCMRYFDGQMYFKDEELKKLLESLSSTTTRQRLRMFEASLAARRRGLGTWLGTPVRLCFLFEDGSTLGKLQGLVKRVRDAVRTSSLSIEDICEKEDRNSDGYLDNTELSNALRRLVSSISQKEITELVKLIDVNGDGAVSYVEVCNLFAVVSSSSSSPGGSGVDDSIVEDDFDDDFDDVDEDSDVEDDDDFGDEELLMPDEESLKGRFDEMELLTPEDY